MKHFDALLHLIIKAQIQEVDQRYSDLKPLIPRYHSQDDEKLSHLSMHLYINQRKYCPFDFIWNLFYQRNMCGLICLSSQFIFAMNKTAFFTKWALYESIIIHKFAVEWLLIQIRGYFQFRLMMGKLAIRTFETLTTKKSLLKLGRSSSSCSEWANEQMSRLLLWSSYS